MIKTKFPDYQTSADPYVLSVFTGPSDMANTMRAVASCDAFAQVQKGLLFARVRPNETMKWVCSDGAEAVNFRELEPAIAP